MSKNMSEYFDQPMLKNGSSSTKKLLSSFRQTLHFRSLVVQTTVLSPFDSSLHIPLPLPPLHPLSHRQHLVQGWRRRSSLEMLNNKSNLASSLLTCFE